MRQEGPTAPGYHERMSERHGSSGGGDELPPEPDDEHRIARLVGRPLLLVFWTLVVWGTVYALVFLVAVVGEGPGPALARATTGPGAVLGIANLALAALSTGVWAIAGTIAWRGRADLT